MTSAVAFFKKRFAAAGTAERASYERAYMKSTLRFHGVDSAAVRAACAEFVWEHRTLDHDGVIAAVDALYATDWFDLHSAAIGILERTRKLKLMTPDDGAWLIALVRRSACWAHVDWLATKIVPCALPAQPAKLLRSWARDDDFWVRRTALLAQLDELRAGRGDFSLFEALAVPMLGEQEFFIRKAIGWVARYIEEAARARGRLRARTRRSDERVDPTRGDAPAAGEAAEGAGLTRVPDCCQPPIIYRYRSRGSTLEQRHSLLLARHRRDRLLP